MDSGKEKLEREKPGKAPRAGFRLLKKAAGCLLAAACFAMAAPRADAGVAAVNTDVPAAPQRTLSSRPSSQKMTVQSLRHAAGGVFLGMPETPWQKSLAGVLQRADDPTEELGAGGAARRAALEAGQGLSGMALLAAVNAFWNRIPWRSDKEVWGREDKWATPGEFALRGGDCEDYAIAKIWTLKELGIPRERMFLVLWRAERGMDAHAALAVMDKDGTAWVLDREGEPIKLEDMRRKRGVPAYVCTESKTWILASKDRASEEAVADAARKMPARTASPRLRPRRG